MSLWSDSFPHCVDVHKIMMFVFLASGIVEDGAVPVFSFEFTMFVRPELIFQWESLFFVLKHIENWFFNESLCFFGFSTIESWFLNESLVFWCQAYWKWIFQWKCLFFWSKAFWKWIFQWDCLFFWPQALWKTVLLFFKMNLQCF